MDVLVKLESQGFPRWAMNTIWLVLLGVSFSICFYAPWDAFRSHTWVLFGSIAMLGCWLLSILGVFLYCSRVERFRWDISSQIALIAILGVGVLIRVAYFYAVHPWPIVSDEAAYLNHARTLLETGSYSTNAGVHVLRAYRPPGFPFFLLPVVAVFGTDSVGVFVVHLVLYVFTSLLVFQLGREFFNREAGSLAVTLVAIWPNLIFSTGVALSEPLAIFLMLVAVWSFWRMAVDTPWPKWAVLAGAAVGLSALVKPSMLLFPSVWIGSIVVLPGRGELIKRAAVAAVVMAAVLLPWATRNYVVLGEFVTVSTNGGSVFYRANNPEASGGFTPRGERDLDALLGDEVAWNRTGFEWGRQWIAENPLKFVKLIFAKQRIFLASDDSGMYWTLERLVEANPSQYGPLQKGLALAGVYVSNLWWFALWVLTAVSLWRYREVWMRPRTAILTLPFLYMLGVHSVFESQPRYHMPVAPLICIVSALPLLGDRVVRARSCEEAEPSELALTSSGA
jgi:4-amino-4-deoxy-L-arabinose transferase-like glycosyltransferase